MFDPFYPQITRLHSDILLSIFADDYSSKTPLQLTTFYLCFRGTPLKNDKTRFSMLCTLIKHGFLAIQGSASNLYGTVIHEYLPYAFFCTVELLN